MYIIAEDKCVSCGLCADECPTGAISQIGPYKINQANCSGCGQCAECCPVEAIIEKEDWLEVDNSLLNNKKEARGCPLASLAYGILAWSCFAVTVTAVHRALTTGSEWYFSITTATGTGYGKHLPLASPGFVLPAPSAFRATCGEVFKSLFGVELLFTRCENEFVSALLAGKALVFKCHSVNNPFQIKLLRLPVLALPDGKAGTVSKRKAI